MPGYSEADEGSGDSGVIGASGPSRDAVKKLDQIIQVGSLTIHQFLGVVMELIAFPGRISTQKLLLSLCNLECPYPLSSQKKESRKSINGYVI